MGDIGPVAARNLRSHGLDVSLVDFPQNTFRDFWGYGRGLGKALAAFCPDLIIPVGDALALSKLRESLGGNVLAAVDSKEKISLLSSKVRTVELASALGCGWGVQCHLQGRQEFWRQRRAQAPQSGLAPKPCGPSGRKAVPH